MNCRGLAAPLLAVLVTFTLSLPVQAQTQVGSTHEVRRGDTLFGVARKAKHDTVSRNQMMLAIFRGNPAAFSGGNIHLLVLGTVLIIPSTAAVAAIDPAEADRQVRDLLAGKPVASSAQVAAVRPPAGIVRPAPKPRPASPGQEQAARRYEDGLALEGTGDHQGALSAFLAAGEGGYGPAQRKLGQIYDKGTPAVARDYQLALHWYQRAREQGVELAKPIQRMTPK